MCRLIGIAILSLAVQSAAAQTLQLNPAQGLPRGSGKPEPAASSQPAAPVAAIRQGYLYVEPYQARFEALFDATSVLRWLHPEQPVPDSLTPEAQQTLTGEAGAKAAEWCQVVTNGQPVPLRFNGATLVKGAPGRTLPLAEGETIAMAQAMVGFTWEIPTPPSPEVIEVGWKGFIDGTDRLPVRVFFGPLSETLEITAAVPQAKWKNNGRLARPKALAEVPTLNTPPPYRVPLASAVWFLGGLLFYVAVRARGHRLPGGTLPFLGAWLVVALLMYPLLVVDIPRGSRAPKIASAAEAEAVITPLLRNVYRAFDHRSESEIYDVLARSVDGPLLRQLYLETIQALTLEGREGTRVTISEFDATVMGVEPDQKRQGFLASCQWTALGSVGHWGHTHQRVNRYTAKLTVSAMQNEWKITGLEVSEARRL